MSKWIDTEVPRVTRECPLPGVVYWGNVNPPRVGDTDYSPDIIESFDASSLEDCAYKALLTVETTNEMAKNNSPLQVWTDEEKGLYERARRVRQVLHRKPDAEIKRAFFTYDSTPVDARNRKACHVVWACSGISQSMEESVSGVVGVDRDGMSAICTTPFYSSECYVNKIDGKAPEQCTALAMKNNLGEKCRAWYSSLPQSTGSPSQATVSLAICDNYPNIRECMCLSRHLDEKFNRYNKGYFGAVSDVCWWQPCKLSGFDRRITPEMDEARNKCASNFCGNFISAIDSQDVNFLSEMKQVVNCSQAEWDEADKKQTGNSGNLTGGNTVSDGGSRGTTVQASQDSSTSVGRSLLGGETSGAVVMALVGVGALFFGGLAVHFYYKSSAAKGDAKQDKSK